MYLGKRCCVKVVGRIQKESNSWFLPFPRYTLHAIKLEDIKIVVKSVLKLKHKRYMAVEDTVVSPIYGEVAILTPVHK